MTILTIAGLPTSSPLLLSLISEESAEGPYYELGDVRLRRFGTRVDFEISHPRGYWQHWYFDDVPAPYSFASLGQAMMLPYALARRKAGSRAARMVETIAPITTALARHLKTSVQGTTIIAVPVTASPPIDDWVARGLTPAETMLGAIVMTALPPSLHRSIDEAWVARSALVCEPALAVWFECQQVMEVVCSLDTESIQDLLNEATVDWKAALSTGADVASDFATILESVVKMFRTG